MIRAWGQAIVDRRIDASRLMACREQGGRTGQGGIGHDPGDPVHRGQGCDNAASCLAPGCECGDPLDRQWAIDLPRGIGIAGQDRPAVIDQDREVQVQPIEESVGEDAVQQGDAAAAASAFGRHAGQGEQPMLKVGVADRGQQGQGFRPVAVLDPCPGTEG